MARKPILCLDFDGVLHSYASGWKGADVIPDGPTAGMVDFLNAAVELFDVQIFSSRSHQPGGIDAMKAWLRECVQYEFDYQFHGGSPRDVDRGEAILRAVSFPLEKPPAMLTIDDRALCFNGNWSDFHPRKLLEFQPWNKTTYPQSDIGRVARQNALQILLIRMGYLLISLAEKLGAK